MRHDHDLRPRQALTGADAAHPATAPASGPRAPVPLPATPVVGSVDDPAEAAADRMADVALARLHTHDSNLADSRAADGGHDTPDGAGAEVHRAPSAPAAQAVVGPAGGALDAHTADVLATRRGRGTPLPAPVRGRMESAFGRSFSGVRIHDDSAAHELSTSLSARAFTAGSDIFFGRGAYDPDSPAGRHVLAHELAHTVQSGDTIGRWSLFGEKKTPEEQAEEQKRKDEKKQQKKSEKEQKQKEKAEAKAQAKITKAAAKENRKLESGERKHLKQERKKGVAKRGELSQAIAEESKNDKVSSSTWADLKQRFEDQLAYERACVAVLLRQGVPEEEAIEQAYQAAWIENADPELNAVRPPRETAAERLAAEVRKARLEDRLDDDTLERGKLGTMLSKGVEEVYEKWELEAERLRLGPPATDPGMADYLAGKTVWEQAGPELRKKRPTDPRIERKARMDARSRLAVGRRGPKEETSELEEAGEVTEKVEGYGSKALTGISKPPAMILAKIGKPLDKQLQKEQGFEPDSTTSETTKSLGMVPVLGGPMKTISTAVDRVKAGKKDDTVTVKPVSVETQASQGIGTATNVLKDLLNSVNGVLKVARSISTAATERSTRAILGATKACNDGAKTAVTMAKDAAELAKAIDPGVSSGVASVVPGLNIAISALSIVGNAVTLADISMRMADTNQSLTDARGRTPGAKKVDVLVYPLLHVHGVYAKKLEQACWSTAVSIANLVTSIATVASGGGYGIPAAVQAGVKLVDLLHSLGHFIADQVIVALAKQSRVDSIAKLEGAAENQFGRDPSMAVDGIVVKAKKGDPVAIKFLQGYGVKQDDVTNDKLGDIRTKVLAGIGENADPAYFYESYRDKIVGVISDIGSIGGRWQSTGRLAKDRNDLEPEGNQRGWAWRVKMMFKGKTKYARSKAKTAAQKESGDAVACRVGKFVLLTDPDPSELDRFTEQVKTLSDQEILDAIADPANAEEWRDALVELLQTRTKKAAADKTPATAGV